MALKVSNMAEGGEPRQNSVFPDLRKWWGDSSIRKNKAYGNSQARVPEKRELHRRSPSSIPAEYWLAHKQVETKARNRTTKSVRGNSVQHSLRMNNNTCCHQPDWKPHIPGALGRVLRMVLTLQWWGITTLN